MTGLEVLAAAEVLPHVDPEAFATPTVRGLSQERLEGSTGTLSYDPTLREVLSRALAVPRADRGLVAIESNGLVRVPLHSLLTHDKTGSTPVTLITEWTAPLPFGDTDALSLAAAYGLHGCEHYYAVKTDDTGSRVRVVFGSWHTGVRDRGLALGLTWHTGKRVFSDGSRTAIGWLSGPYSAEIEEWLVGAGLLRRTPVG